MFSVDVSITQTCIFASVGRPFWSYSRVLELQGNYWVLGGVSLKGVNKEK